jgi:GDP-D-mannose dehydratase
MVPRAAFFMDITGQDGAFLAELLPPRLANALVSRRPASMIANCCTVAEEQTLSTNDLPAKV